MSPFSTLLYAAEQNIAHVTLSRPERPNALGRLSLPEINVALDLAEADDNVKAIVISGAGKAFSSGCDLKDHERADQCMAADRA
jgi:enoyl-CoA hydratase/carnithine racemase